MSVTIGIDPHKSTHTAVAVDRDELPIARLTLAASRCQTDRLLAWAKPLDDDRVWAIESAAGLGRLPAQQLVAAGERVIDVPPTLVARVRLLYSSKSSKNDPNDAVSTAIAGLRHCRLRRVERDDHTVVLRLLADPAPRPVRLTHARKPCAVCTCCSANSPRVVSPPPDMRGCSSTVGRLSGRPPCDGSHTEQRPVTFGWRRTALLSGSLALGLVRPLMAADPVVAPGWARVHAAQRAGDHD